MLTGKLTLVSKKLYDKEGKKFYFVQLGDKSTFTKFTVLCTPEQVASLVEGTEVTVTITVDEKRVSVVNIK